MSPECTEENPTVQQSGLCLDPSYTCYCPAEECASPCTCKSGCETGDEAEMELGLCPASDKCCCPIDEIVSHQYTLYLHNISTQTENMKVWQF